MHNSYVTDNPGAWLLHCHVQWHLVVSIASIMLLSPDLFTTVTTTSPHILIYCLVLFLFVMVRLTKPPLQSGMALVLVEGESQISSVVAASNTTNTTTSTKGPSSGSSVMVSTAAGLSGRYVLDVRLFYIITVFIGFIF